MPTGVETDVATDLDGGGAFSQATDVFEGRDQVVLGSDDAHLLLHHVSQVVMNGVGVFSLFTAEWREHLLCLLLHLVVVERRCCGPFGGMLSGEFACPLPEDDQVGERVATETVGTVHASGHFPGGKKSRDTGLLAVGIDTNAAHRVMARRADFHRLGGDVDVGQLFELVVHRWQFSLDCLGASLAGNVQEYASVW